MEIMEFYCKYGTHSNIGYYKKITQLKKSNVTHKCLDILDEKLEWVKNFN